jgi:hypothetical protein
VKRFYARTNKNRAVRQMTQLERRETALMRIAARAQINTRRKAVKPTAQKHQRKLQKPETYVSFAEFESLPYTAPDEHHHISPSLNFPLYLSSWLKNHHGDPATAVSIFFFNTGY